MSNRGKSFAFVIPCLLGTLILLFGSLLSHAQTGDLTATIDRPEISVEETLTLRVRYSGQAPSGQPDFSLLEENFDIISRQQSNQISTIHGRMSAFTEWTLTIAPKRTGELLIPSFEFRNNFSDAIQVTVTQASAPPGQLKDIFVETEIGKPDVYVQEQVRLTFRLYTTRSIDSLDAAPLEIDGVRVEELPQARFQRRIDGVNYGVLEVPYALFPQTSDDFTIPAQRWTVRAVTSPNTRSFAFGASRYELKRLMTQEKQVKVRARPNTYPTDATWLPAQNVTLSEQWSNSPTEFRVGEPLTRTITLRAEGLTAAQLPPLPIDQAPQGYKLYADQPSLENDTTAHGITGIRTESMAIVPNTAGELTIPPVKIVWWDTEAEALRTAELPEQTFYVQADAGAPSQPLQRSETATAAPDTETAPGPLIGETQHQTNDRTTTSLLWPLLTLILALLCCLFAVLWVRARRRLAAVVGAASASSSPVAATADEKRAFKRVQAAGANKHLAQLRSSLLAWSGTRWPQSPPKTLQQLAQVINDDQITKHLRALDEALFGQAGAQVDCAALTSAMQKWRNDHKTTQTQTRHNLKPLYTAS